MTNSAVNYRPHLTELLAALGLDLAYESGQGARISYTDERGRRVDVLDLVGGYGTLLFGHSHPRLIQAACQFLQSFRPVFVQGSAQRTAGELAAELSRRAGGDYVCVFSNSGTESIEAGLKHAMLERRARRFLVLEGGFHGKTLGSLQVTHNSDVRQPFDLAQPTREPGLGIQIERIPREDRFALEAAFGNPHEIAALVIEPIQGEAGVRGVTAEFLHHAERLCQLHDVPLFADECQTGMGRTGTFLASHATGLRPDYVALSKSLGGGIGKIGATLIARRRYQGSFDFLHTSTYAADEFSCQMATETLRLLDDSQLLQIRETGQELVQRLRLLQTNYPDIIADVRGFGLLLGIEFRRLSESDSFCLRMLGAQDKFLYLICAYLLREHRIRVLPTLSDPWTLRLQPPVCLSAGDMDQLISALSRVCRLVRNPNFPALAMGMIEQVPDEATVLHNPWPERKLIRFRSGSQSCTKSDSPSRRVAWLCHMIDVNDLVPHEPGLESCGRPERDRLADRFAPFATPVLMGESDIRTATGQFVRMYPIMLPVTSRFIKSCLDTGRVEWCRSLIRDGVVMAQSLGCSLVSLGQYTSIVTRNGALLSDLTIGLTSGNSFTVALTIQALERILVERAWNSEDRTLCIVGAVGNIGKTCASLLAPRFAETILVGTDRARSVRRLKRLAEQLPNSRVETDLQAVRQAQVVVSAANSVHAPIRSDHLADGALFCDISVPASVHSGVVRQRPDVIFLRGGLSKLPNGEDLQIASFPLPAGQTYGCMAEALLLGAEGICDQTYTGDVTPQKVRFLEQLARRHGFELADAKQTCVLGMRDEETTDVAR